MMEKEKNIFWQTLTLSADCNGAKSNQCLVDDDRNSVIIATSIERKLSVYSLGGMAEK